MVLRPDLLGARSEPLEFAWTADDVMLYALAVGAGQDDPVADLALTTENTEGAAGPTVLPSFANIITRGARVDLGDDPRVLHAEQAFRVPTPLPPHGRARVTATVVGVEDKRSGVLVRTRADAVDATTGAPVASTLQTVMVRGETSGATAAAPADDLALTRPPGPVPDRGPDHRIPVRIRGDQALLYRLTGDRNPLHTDPAFARRAGFDRPILHGMCTYGFTARTVTAALGGDPERLVAMHARFTRPVVPGDALEVHVWLDDGGAHVRTVRDGEPVLDHGWAELR